MLTPTYLEQLPEPMIELISQLQDEIIADITKRIVKGKYDTPSAQWMLYKANQLRLSSADVNKLIAKGANVRERTIRDMYSDSVKLALHEDAEIYRYAISENKLPAENGDKITSYFRDVAHNDFFRRGLKNTQGLMRNLTNSMAATANRTLSDALDLAWLEVSSGAFTVDEACFKAVTALTAKGLAVVEYKSGHKDQVDVAVRRAVRTGINKTCCDMQLNFAAEMGSDLVEVSSHLGARPTHADWQGQIYSISGKHPKYKPFSVTGYGTGDGLGGWNCRHSFFPYFEGLSIAANMPDFTTEENREMYDNQQQQRAYERAVRKSKRELAGIDAARQATADPALKDKLDKEFARKSVTLKRREERLEAWCEDKGLQLDSSRVRTAGFGRSVSQKAVWANRRFKENHRNLAKASDLFDCSAINSVSGTISPEEIINELLNSPIGMETLQYLEETGIKPKLSYAKMLDGRRGDQLGDEIRIFLSNIKSPRVAAQTIIHEVTHHKYKIEKSQWAEAVCMAKEKMHIVGRNHLTIAEKRYIVRLALEAYPEYNWKRGGYINGKRQ